MIELIVADDHVVLREALCKLLEAKGKFKVIGQASNGVQLMKLLGEMKPDVLIIDMAMPEMNGLEALKQISQQKLAVPTLVLSADDQTKNVRTAINNGARGYLPKNVDVDELSFAIDAILKGNTYLSPSITETFLQNSESQPSTPNPLQILTRRELEVLKFLAEGKPNREIGTMLHISTRTVDTHRSNILKKLGLKTNAELVKLAIARGIVSI